MMILRRSVLLGKLDDMVSWGRKNSSGHLVLVFRVVLWKWLLHLPAVMILHGLGER